MKIMRAAIKATLPATWPATWLKTDQPVVPINPSTWQHQHEVENALRLGVTAIADDKRPGFYEIEVGSNWYYIHIPSRISGVFLVAAGKRLTPARTQVLAHQCA